MKETFCGHTTESDTARRVPRFDAAKESPTQKARVALDCPRRVRESVVGPAGGSTATVALVRTQATSSTRGEFSD